MKRHNAWRLVSELAEFREIGRAIWPLISLRQAAAAAPQHRRAKNLHQKSLEQQPKQQPTSVNWALLSLFRRGLSRDQAANYIGVGPTKFDKMVKDGRMPRPKRVDGRVVWDLRKLDAAFAALEDDDPDKPETNPWDAN